MKYLLTILLALVSLFPASAQTKIAIKAGFNYSTARAYFDNIKQSTGFVAGGNFAIQLKTRFEGPLHFSPYIAYSTRGFTIESKSNTGDRTHNFIHYVDVAPVLSLDFRTGINNMLVIGVGPIAGLAISGRERTTVGDTTRSSKMNFSTSKDYGLFDLGLHTSVGWHFKKIFVEAVYQHGFASINNNEEIDKKNIRNRSLSLNLGYYLRSYK